jgi:hypothetical protein
MFNSLAEVAGEGALLSEPSLMFVSLVSVVAEGVLLAELPCDRLHPGNRRTTNHNEQDTESPNLRTIPRPFDRRCIIEERICRRTTSSRGLQRDATENRSSRGRLACMFTFTAGTKPEVSSVGESRGGLSVC